MTEWQPIESAPRDGRKLLMWHQGFGLDALVLYWMDGYWREPANGLGLKSEPSHWMAIPPAPTQKEAA